MRPGWRAALSRWVRRTLGADVLLGCAVIAPDRLVWIEPAVEGGMQTTITFVDLHDGRTEAVTQQTNVPTAYLSAEARAGFTTSLDRLDVYLAGLNAEQEHQQE